MSTCFSVLELVLPSNSWVSVALSSLAELDNCTGNMISLTCLAIRLHVEFCLGLYIANEGENGVQIDFIWCAVSKKQTYNIMCACDLFPPSLPPSSLPPSLPPSPPPSLPSPPSLPLLPLPLPLPHVPPEENSGSWEDGMTPESSTMLYRALHNIIERSLDL